MGDVRTWLNAVGIFAATTFVIVYFQLSPLWYSAALLAWIVRRQRLYHASADKAADAGVAQAADQTAENSS
jgi:hypothetical protein